ncbi:hypothetical protein BC940DRAFT_303231 [Gongronella butleri]|nr:hypothetical protein BC940DRAFT_303231 [Gongronella butleri]
MASLALFRRCCYEPLFGRGVRGISLTAVRGKAQTYDLEELVSAVEQLRPKQRILRSENKYAQVGARLGMQFTVPQLQTYLREQGIKPKKRKAELQEQIVHEYWGVTTHDRVLQEQEHDRQHTQQHVFQLAPDQLFFLLADNGNVFCEIEDQFPRSNIMINVASGQCTIVAPDRHMDAMQKAVHDALQLQRVNVRLASSSDHTASLETLTQPILDDLSMLAGVHMTVDNDTISMSAKSQSSLERAKRLLSVLLTDLGLTPQPSFQEADMTVLQQALASTNEPPLSFLPLHDAATMPPTVASMGWSRLQSAYHTHAHGFISLDRSLEDGATEQEIKCQLESLVTPHDEKHPVVLEAKLGHLLFENPQLHPGQLNLLTPELEGHFTVDDLKNMFLTSTKHRRFYAGNPPERVRSSLVPLSFKGGHHRRVVKVDYIASMRLGQFLSDTDTLVMAHSPYQRLQLTFAEQDDGSLSFENATTYHQQATAHLLQLNGQIDAQLTAQRVASYDTDIPSPIRALIDQCHMASYSDLDCPNFWRQTEMTLLGVALHNESRYQFHQNQVNLSYINDQETRTRRAELKIIAPPSPSFDHWPSFWDSITSLSKRWIYK